MIHYHRGSKVPYSDAKTAYTLLSDVIRTILEEPKRVHMDNWLLQGEGVKDFLYRKGVLDIGGPACGTIGCISGWITTLKPNANVSSIAGEDIIAPYIGWGGGIDGAYLRRQEMREAADAMFMDTTVDATYGTRKYARIVAGRIRKFQKVWAKDLKAIQV